MTMRCPHCDIAFHDTWYSYGIKDGIDGWDKIKVTICPTCGKATMRLLHVNRYLADSINTDPKELEMHIYPRLSARTRCPPEVPDVFAEDFNQACLILYDSPKAAAALARRCLQHILREKGGVKKGNLSKEIDEVIDSNKLPSDICEQLDAVRNYGNFAAHAEENIATGEIIAVEPSEAEWTLNILEELFDFYFVRPERIKRKKDGLNAKLSSVGKPPMKDNSP